MAKPDYVAQAHPDDIGAPGLWIETHANEAFLEGCKAVRVSRCPQGTWPHLDLILVEGWKDKDADQGDPHWQLAAFA